MDVEDISGLGAPLKKLIEVVSQGIGAISAPYIIKRKADAKAYEMQKIAESVNNCKELGLSVQYSENDGLSISTQRDDPGASFPQRTINRLIHQEMKHQKNLERIVQITSEQLESESNVSSEKLDEDWVSKFFDITRNVSNNEMQIIWSRILAGEIKTPRSFSLRTLEFLKCVSQEEARVFSRVANYALSRGDQAYILADFDFFEKERGVNFSDFLMLEELDLISKATDRISGIHLPFDSVTEGIQEISFIYGEQIVLIRRKSGAPSIQLKVAPLTRIAFDLLKIIRIETDHQYIRLLAEKFKHEKVSAYCAMVTSMDGALVEYDDSKIEVLYESSTN